MEGFSLASTVVSPDKIAAYGATAYRVEAIEQPFVFTIGEQSPPLLQLYASTGCDCALFITAFNPSGRSRDKATNDDAHRALGLRLAALTPRLIEGVGRDTLGDWPAEKSFLALGIARDVARQLGSAAGQDAVVWCGADAVPELVLLR
jgi:hypothetical protein